MIGGIQRYNAILRINDINQITGRNIITRKCAVYGKGLTRAALLVLARQHNEINQVQRVTSFPEVAACCRRLLFSHFAEGASDDGVTNPSLPRYNTQAYRAFKQECMTFLLSSQTVCGNTYMHTHYKTFNIILGSCYGRSSNTNGSTKSLHLPQDAGCFQVIRGGKAEGPENEGDEGGDTEEGPGRETCP